MGVGGGGGGDTINKVKILICYIFFPPIHTGYAIYFCDFNPMGLYHYVVNSLQGPSNVYFTLGFRAFSSQGSGIKKKFVEGLNYEF